MMIETKQKHWIITKKYRIRISCVPQQFYIRYYCQLKQRSVYLKTYPLHFEIRWKNTKYAFSQLKKHRNFHFKPSQYRLVLLPEDKIPELDFDKSLEESPLTVRETTATESLTQMNFRIQYWQCFKQGNHINLIFDPHHPCIYINVRHQSRDHAYFAQIIISNPKSGQIQVSSREKISIPLIFKIITESQIFIRWRENKLRLNNAPLKSISLQRPLFVQKQFSKTSQKSNLFIHIFVTEIVAHMIINHFGRNKLKQYSGYKDKELEQYRSWGLRFSQFRDPFFISQQTNKKMKKQNKKKIVSSAGDKIKTLKQISNFTVITGQDKSRINKIRKYLYQMTRQFDKTQACIDFMELATEVVPKSDFFPKNLKKGKPQNQVLWQKTFHSLKNNLKSKLNFKACLSEYTKDTFFHQIMNKGLRSLKSPQQILLLRLPFFNLFWSIKKIYQRYLRAILKQQEKKNKNRIIYLYRHCIVSDRQMQKIRQNIGEFIQMEGFISTSRDEDYAKNFSGNCFITIQIPVANLKGFYDNGFANLKHYSSYSNEDQVLINAFNVFKILEFEQKNDEFYISLEYGSIKPIQEKMMKSSFLVEKQKNLLEKIINFTKRDRQMKEHEKIWEIQKKQQFRKQQNNLKNYKQEIRQFQRRQHQQHRLLQERFGENLQQKWSLFFEQQQKLKEEKQWEQQRKKVKQKALNLMAERKKINKDELQIIDQWEKQWKEVYEKKKKLIWGEKKQNQKSIQYFLKKIIKNDEKQKVWQKEWYWREPNEEKREMLQKWQFKEEQRRKKVLREWVSLEADKYAEHIEKLKNKRRNRNEDPLYMERINWNFFFQLIQQGNNQEVIRQIRLLNTRHPVQKNKKYEQNLMRKKKDWKYGWAQSKGERIKRNDNLMWEKSWHCEMNKFNTRQEEILESMKKEYDKNIKKLSSSEEQLYRNYYYQLREIENIDNFGQLLWSIGEFELCSLYCTQKLKQIEWIKVMQGCHWRKIQCLISQQLIHQQILYSCYEVMGRPEDCYQNMKKQITLMKSINISEENHHYLDLLQKIYCFSKQIPSKQSDQINYQKQLIKIFSKHKYLSKSFLYSKAKSQLKKYKQSKHQFKLQLEEISKFGSGIESFQSLITLYEQFMDQFTHCQNWQQLLKCYQQYSSVKNIAPGTQNRVHTCRILEILTGRCQNRGQLEKVSSQALPFIGNQMHNPQEFRLGWRCIQQCLLFQNIPFGKQVLNKISTSNIHCQIKAQDFEKMALIGYLLLLLSGQYDVDWYLKWLKDFSLKNSRYRRQNVLHIIYCNEFEDQTDLRYKQEEDEKMKKFIWNRISKKWNYQDSFVSRQREKSRIQTLPWQDPLYPLKRNVNSIEQAIKYSLDLSLIPFNQGINRFKDKIKCKKTVEKLHKASTLQKNKNNEYKVMQKNSI